jgi:hypothetical protein
LQRGLSLKFTKIEQALRTKFLPALLGNESVLEDARRQLTCFPVKCTGIAIPNPTQTADKNWNGSTVVGGHLTSALRGKEVFRFLDHQAIMATGKAEIGKQNMKDSEGTMESLLRTLPDGQSHSI